ncbi:putative RNA pseudouridine synthase [Gossypium australe]|uniref:Putative RNA pseudouridine synthase n=1 Tax=Gossypium australe TaxID=47621 RepID=A0A5B6WJS3_9ROSI|nr:putative RNA pseudouridine synthase [Gossypium australe]
MVFRSFKVLILAFGTPSSKLIRIPYLYQKQPSQCSNLEFIFLDREAYRAKTERPSHNGLEELKKSLLHRETVRRVIEVTASSEASAFRLGLPYWERLQSDITHPSTRRFL